MNNYKGKCKFMVERLGGKPWHAALAALGALGLLAIYRRRERLQTDG